MTIAKEEGEFDFSDVYDALCKKLITRHTHIFGEDKARSSEEALKNWEKNKLREKKHNLCGAESQRGAQGYAVFAARLQGRQTRR